MGCERFGQTRKSQAVQVKLMLQNRGLVIQRQRPLPPCSPPLTAQLGLQQQPLQCIGEQCRLLRWYQQSGDLRHNLFTAAANVGRHNREPRQHRLDHGVRQALAP